jgi:hypothetical protein
MVSALTLSIVWSLLERGIRGYLACPLRYPVTCSPISESLRLCPRSRVNGVVMRLAQ